MARRLLNRRTVLGALLLLLLAIFLPPFVNVSRFRPRIVSAISNALGRPVSVGDVSLRLFPTPALNLSRFVVQDDPAFSAEPLLRADEVTASLRLASLWRGRLEVARLSLSSPSLNLVRRADGHWNLESLLERARQTPTAPTALRRAESRPRFPYVEADGGRINLKIGQEKKVYALSEADFALWMASENEWRLRLQARPVRTDANLSDTGTVKLSGKIGRAAALSETPLEVQAVLDRAQLGQLTTLIYGRDRGWRGTVNVSMRLRGTPAQLSLASDASVDDFRRYDIATRGALRLAAQCTAGFSTTTQQFSDIACHSRAGSGSIEVRGTAEGIAPLRAYRLAVTLDRLPADTVLALGRRMKKDLPEDLVAGGLLDGSFELRRTGLAAPAEWIGTGATTELALRSSSMREPLRVGRLRFSLGVPPLPKKPARASAALVSTGVTALHVEPLALDLGANAPARLEASFSQVGYGITVSGEAPVARLVELARTAGLPAPLSSATGQARVDLQLAGTWTGFAAPLVTGSAQVRGKAWVPGINAPVQVTSASVLLLPQGISVQNLAGNFADSRLEFTGSFALPRGCKTLAACPIRFQLHATQVSTDELNRLLNPSAAKRPWYDLISTGRPKSLLARLTAGGQFTIGRLLLRSVAATRVSGDLHLERGMVVATNLRGELLGGTHNGELRADFTGAQPVYSAQGMLTQFSVAALAGWTRENWGTGHATAGYRVAMWGFDEPTLRASATGSLTLDWRDGTLAHWALNGSTVPLRIRQFHGEATLRDGQLSFAPSKMETASGIYVVSGTASLDRELGLRLARGKTQAVDVTGTLDQPRFKSLPLPETQAALKP